MRYQSESFWTQIDIILSFQQSSREELNNTILKNWLSGELSLVCKKTLLRNFYRKSFIEKISIFCKFLIVSTNFG